MKDPATESRQRSLERRRNAAKLGMTGSMAVLLWTAMRGGRRLMPYHTAAGIALMGFTVWHMMLYNTGPRRRDR